MTLNFGKFFQGAELKENKLITRFSANQPPPQKEHPVSTAWEIDPASSM
jgi:hypothetical protein